MNNNQLIKFLRDNLMQGFTSQGRQIRTKQSYSSVKTSAPNEPCVFIHRLNTERIGWQSKKGVIELGQGQVVEDQNLITYFQLNAEVPNVLPINQTIDDMDANDLLELASMVLQSQPFRTACKDAGVNTLPISAITPNWVLDENDNWTPEPMLTVAICHKATLKGPIGKVTEIQSGFHRV